MCTVPFQAFAFKLSRKKTFYKKFCEPLNKPGGCSLPARPPPQTDNFLISLSVVICLFVSSMGNYHHHPLPMLPSLPTFFSFSAQLYRAEFPSLSVTSGMVLGHWWPDSLSGPYLLRVFWFLEIFKQQRYCWPSSHLSYSTFPCRVFLSECLSTNSH